MLRHCLPSSVRRTLDELPESLDETYSRVLKEIKRPNRDHALRLLQCLVVAIRPLRVEELAEVLAVEFDDAEGIPKLKPDWRWEDEEQALLTSCSSLITIVNADKERVVQFSHFSVKEFLTSPRLATSSEGVSHYHIVLETAHTILAQACLSVLLWLDDGIDKSSIRKSFPLALYAAEHWSSHAQFKAVSTSLRRAMECLFDLDKPHFAAWLQIHDIDTHPSSDSSFFLFAPARKSSAIPLYYAALCGFLDLVRHLIVKHPQHVDAHGGHYVTPLVAALAGEHFQVAQILLENGAEMDVRGGFERTPLIDALVKERLELARWLLSRGADPNVRETKGWTALHFAAWEGRVGVVRVLLHHDGVDPNVQEKNRWTALHFTASNSHVEIVRILLRHDHINPNVEDSGGWTPLHFASSEGHVEVVRMLLRHDRTDANVQEEGGQTALHLAASRGRVEVVQMLLQHNADHGAHSNIQCKDGRTALHLAVSQGHLEVVRTLLQHSAAHGVLLEDGADVNRTKGDGSTPLHEAATHGRLEIARLLVEHGANLDIEDNEGRTAVQIAMAKGHRDIVNLLSDRSSL
jgi:ankyrin repeat protein